MIEVRYANFFYDEVWSTEVLNMKMKTFHPLISFTRFWIEDFSDPVNLHTILKKICCSLKGKSLQIYFALLAFENETIIYIRDWTNIHCNWLKQTFQSERSLKIIINTFFKNTRSMTNTMLIYYVFFVILLADFKRLFTKKLVTNK